MGIKNLMKTLSEEAAGCVREVTMKQLGGRIVALDASMALYQFLIAVRASGDGAGPTQMLTNEAGEVTSHIQGMFNRTIRLMENGIKVKNAETINSSFPSFYDIMKSLGANLKK